MSIDAVVNALMENGIFAAMVIYFVWQGWRREARLAKRIDHLEDEQNTLQTELIRNTTEALTETTIALKHNSNVMEKGTLVLERVCSYLDRAEQRESQTRTS